ncbi:hypothetical protein TNCV_3725401 [Trichonephila clavipes]|nr:hypothetical protein TNCV_3725401 [Trichonephila clavipes]
MGNAKSFTRRQSGCGLTPLHSKAIIFEFWTTWFSDPPRSIGFKSSHSNISGWNHQIDVILSSHDIGSIVLKQNDHGWLKFNRPGLR